MAKLAQGAMDLHSARCQVDFAALADLAGKPLIVQANSALEAYEMAGSQLAEAVARAAVETLRNALAGAPVEVDVVVIDRSGSIVGRAAQ